MESLNDDLASVGTLMDRSDDAHGLPPSAEPRSARPDVAAAALLFARAIIATPGVVEGLRTGAPVVAIDTRRADLVAPIRTVLHLFFPMLTIVGSRQTHKVGAELSVPLIIQRDGLARGDKPESGNDLVLSAFQDHRPIIGISSSPKQFLPRSLVEVADFEVKLDHIDASSVRVLKVPLSTIVVVVVVGFLSTIVHFFVVASRTT